MTPPSIEHGARRPPRGPLRKPGKGLVYDGSAREGKVKKGARSKVLVVDDNREIRLVVSKMLACLGFTVVSADSGENGLGLFQRDTFDVVLSDYDMPGMDGVAFADNVKERSPDTRVVIMTGAGTFDVFSRMSAAVDRVISKPFTLEEITSVIQPA